MKRTDLKVGMNVFASGGGHRFTARITDLQQGFGIRFDGGPSHMLLRYYKKSERWQGSRGHTNGVYKKPVIVEEIIPPTSEELDDIDFKIRKFKSLLHAVNVFAVKCGVDADTARELSKVINGLVASKSLNHEQQIKIAKMYERAEREYGRLNYLINCTGKSINLFE